ncbi:predicted protein [Sclerotinia sclerotiorum 1980 UF-70]|uniref:Uncharacterized protein n=1 Tax=Sclerotinia sclerotiorum (strain ATCC 18683 / 1980 / Ss-1) TaxID=665079 RepID=A7EQM6_SCLS1|nr:predicted protein [Sclerotinia sclerotiorum 1980 UF-70]EDN91768.1 predicted protein [Sclerotinia sclerotiorum 1980 UF-70]
MYHGYQLQNSSSWVSRHIRSAEQLLANKLLLPGHKQAMPMILQMQMIDQLINWLNILISDKKRQGFFQILWRASNTAL